jgi:predicted ATPase
VASTVAGVLGLGLGGDQISAEAVARAVGRRKLLLVLDNCEHVIEAAARLAETLVRLCPSTSVLATSREVLRIEGEFVYRVPSLEVPAEPQQETGNPIEHSAVRLFIARTGALAPDFSPDAEHLPTIAAICRHLDGIPLAIELAAARAATLSVSQVAARLADRFGFLTVGRRTALPRHQTLRATLDWSYGLLPETERYLLRRLAVFAGGFTLESAAAVASDRVADVSSIVEGISNLVSKSLVTLIELAPVGRWRLLETIRAYAIEKLAESGQANQAARRHAEFYRDLFAAAAPGSRLQPSAAEMIRFSREIDNVRAALDWCFSPTGEAAVGVVLSAVCAPAWVHSALLAECHERTERALNHIDPALKLSASLQMQLHLALGLSLGLTMGSVERAKAALAKALELAESLDDSEAQLRALWGLWALHFNIGETRATQLIVEQFSRVAGDAGDQAAVLISERLLGYTLQHSGQNRRAQECFEHVLELYVMRDRRYVLMLQLDQRVLARAMLARVLWLQGFAEQAIAQARTSLEEAQATDYRLSICEALRLALCPVLLMTGDLAAGGRAVAMLIEVADRSNAAFWKILGRCLQGKLLIMRAEFSAGAALLRSEFDASERSGWAIWQPEYMGALAEGLAGLGRLSEALAAVDQALAKADAGGERYYVPELLRIKGELLLRDTGDGCVAAAENCFDRALAVAREQDALFWELRGALSLARLRTRQDRPDEARQILAPVYDRFTEGFETADLRAARAMLESLPS